MSLFCVFFESFLINWSTKKGSKTKDLWIDESIAFVVLRNWFYGKWEGILKQEIPIHCFHPRIKVLSYQAIQNLLKIFKSKSTWSFENVRVQETGKLITIFKSNLIEQKTKKTILFEYSMIMEVTVTDSLIKVSDNILEALKVKCSWFNIWMIMIHIFSVVFPGKFSVQST